MKISATTRKCIFVLLLAGISVCLLGLIFHPFEPRYQGRRLTEWAKEVCPPDLRFAKDWRPPALRAQSDRAVAAIQHIGAKKALPWALKLCRARDSWFKRKLEDGIEDWVGHHNDQVDGYNEMLPRDQWRSEIHVAFTTAADKHYEGGNIIRALGSMAEPATPALIQLLQNRDWKIAQSAIYALPGIGTNAIPPVMALLASTNQDARIRAATVLGRFGPQARMAVPALVQCLENPDFAMGSVAIRSLGLIASIQEDAPLVVPAIIHYLQSETNNWGSLMGPVRVLGNFGTNAQPAVPLLVHILESKPEGPGDDSLIKISALRALAKMGPEVANRAVPVLLHILESKPQWPDGDYSSLKISALFTLSKIDPKAAQPFVPMLLHILESKSDWPGGYSPGQMLTLVALWRVDPEAAQPFFEKWQPNQPWVVDELEQIEPDAAKPFLEEWQAGQTNAPAASALDGLQTSHPPIKHWERPMASHTNSPSP